MSTILGCECSEPNGEHETWCPASPANVAKGKRNLAAQPSEAAGVVKIDEQEIAAAAHEWLCCNFNEDFPVDGSSHKSLIKLILSIARQPVPNAGEVRRIECNAILMLMGAEPYLAKGHVENGEYKWTVVADKISVTELRGPLAASAPAGKTPVVSTWGASEHLTVLPKGAAPAGKEGGGDVDIRLDELLNHGVEHCAGHTDAPGSCGTCVRIAELQELKEKQ